MNIGNICYLFIIDFNGIKISLKVYYQDITVRKKMRYKKNKTATEDIRMLSWG